MLFWIYVVEKDCVYCKVYEVLYGICFYFIINLCESLFFREMGAGGSGYVSYCQFIERKPPELSVLDVMVKKRCISR